MTTESSTIIPASTVNLDHETSGLIGTNQVANAIKKRWQRGEKPDVTAALANHPELHQYRSVVLDLAYTEYRLRLESGEPLDAQSFSRQFPSLERSLHLLIEVHSLLSQDPELQNLQDSLRWPEAGDRFLQFELIAEIGRGAFGRVFLAIEPALGRRQIVVKIAPHAGGEAEILGKLRHPNIVPIYSVQEDKATGLAALCMPYVGQATLCNLLDEAFCKGRPPLQARAILEAIAAVDKDVSGLELPRPASILSHSSYVNGVVHLVIQLANALAHAHGRGIYHRDLKPSNVLMTEDGRPLLLDFNLSVNAGLPEWKIGGTLPYMAPEELAYLCCAKREPGIRHYDPRSDLFSLGVILYELLTGTHPFQPAGLGQSLDVMADQLQQQQKKGAQPVQEKNRQVDRHLARLVESCLAFEPDHRPQTAKQLADLLTQELSPVRRSRRWMRNHSRFCVGVGIAFSLLIFAVIMFFVLRPAYDVRQLQLGLGYLDRGESSLAINYLNNSLDANPTGDALFARGRAFQSKGEFLIASRDYNSAYQLNPNPTSKACEGYCLSRGKSPRAAIAAYNVALKAGYKSPVLLYTNIGYSHLLLGENDEAEKFFQQAFSLNNEMQVVHRNMLSILLRRAVAGKPVSKAAFYHATRAIEIGPHDADLYFKVATLYAIASKQDPTLVQPAIAYVARAVELGQEPNVFTSNGSFSILQKEKTFHDALERTAVVVKPSAVLCVLDPLDIMK